jgi:3-hydroxybutyryl-CoA dehydrogenase
MSVSNVGIIGAGIMGTGIAADVAARGMHVVLHDNSADALAAAEHLLRDNINLLRFASTQLGKVTDDDILSRIERTTELAEVRDVDLIVENITEDISLKEELYGKLRTVCRTDAILGVNTSCISIARLAAFSPPAARVVGMHFMNPVPMKKMVEVVRGPDTSETTLDLVRVFLQQLDKEPIIVNDSPGFVSNRVMMPMINECAFLVLEKVATPQEIDKVFRLGFAHTMGPLATADLIGLDTVLHSMEVLHQSFNDAKYRPCPLLKKMVAAGLLGRKSGEGFFKYPKAG